MSTLNRDAYVKLLEEDREWLMQQPRSLERDHLEQVIAWKINYARMYGTKQVEMAAENKRLREIIENVISTHRLFNSISDYCRVEMDKLRIPQ